MNLERRGAVNATPCRLKGQVQPTGVNRQSCTQVERARCRDRSEPQEIELVEHVVRCNRDSSRNLGGGRR